MEVGKDINIIVIEVCAWTFNPKTRLSLDFTTMDIRNDRKAIELG
jgi:hypothetical protein